MAAAAGEKSLAMLHVRDLEPLTGYVRGGCSPVGMKKIFPTTIDSSAQRLDKIFFSAGKIGLQLEVQVADIEKVIKYQFAEIC